jgi:hypothetical protein
MCSTSDDHQHAGTSDVAGDVYSAKQMLFICPEKEHATNKQRSLTVAGPSSFFLAARAARCRSSRHTVAASRPSSTSLQICGAGVSI